MTAQAHEVRGYAAPGYEPVAEHLAQLEDADPTYSAQFAAYRGSELVVDLACGPWPDDALLPVFSCGKGAIGATVALLVQRGDLSLDATVAHYWPEFAAAGKADVTVRQLLSHQAGLPTVDGGFSGAELLAHDPLAARLAAQRPFWRPGSAFGYHALTIGVLADELVRRASGRTLAEVFRDDIAAPRAIDFYLGTPVELDPRVVDVDLPTADELPPGGMPVNEPGSLRALLGPTDTAPLWTWANEVEHRRVGPPAAGSLATAKGLAGMYAALISDDELVAGDVVAQMAQIQVHGHDIMSGLPFRYGIMFQRPEPPRLDYGSYLSFGHDGLGGCLGVADPFFGLAFGYTVKRIPLPGGCDARAVDLMRTVTRHSPSRW